MTANATELEAKLLERRMDGGARHPQSKSINFNLKSELIKLSHKERIYKSGWKYDMRLRWIVKTHH